MNTEEIQNLIKELVEKTTVNVQDVVVTEETPTSIWISVEVGEPHFFISHEGEGLQALNHIIHRILEPKKINTVETTSGPSVLVDINGFQKKRVESIRAIAHMMSERARYFKSSVEVDPMSAFERRIVHEFLANENDIKTESTGEGRTRRVVIKYIGSI